jgi:hypothetical protein
LEFREETGKFAWGRKSGKTSYRKKELISVLKHALAFEGTKEMEGHSRWKNQTMQRKHGSTWAFGENAQWFARPGQEALEGQDCEGIKFYAGGLRSRTHALYVQGLEAISCAQPPPQI